MGQFRPQIFLAIACLTTLSVVGLFHNMPEVSTATAISSKHGVCNDGKYIPCAINLRLGRIHVKSDLLLERKNLANVIFQSTLGASAFSISSCK